MNPDPSNSVHRPTLGEQVRNIADQLKAETALQVKVTSRILGAAAQIANHHDQLIGEVVEMVEEDLEYQNTIAAIQLYTVESLKQQFKTLAAAKAHFRIKAPSWVALVEKLNPAPTPQSEPPERSLSAFSERLETIEQELKDLRTDTRQILDLLQQLVLDLRS